jgi:hypothetical protein
MAVDKHSCFAISPNPSMQKKKKKNQQLLYQPFTNCESTKPLRTLNANANHQFFFWLELA